MKRQVALVGLTLFSVGLVAAPAKADNGGSDSEHSFTLTCVNRRALFTNTSTAEEDSNILITDNADPFPDNLRFDLAVGETGELTWTRGGFGGVNWHVYWSPGGSVDRSTWIEIGSGEEDYPDVCPPSPPTAPRALVATPGNASVTLTWGYPANDGGAFVDSFGVLHRRVGETVWRGLTFIPGFSVRTHTFTGLTNGVRYEFRVFATNQAGFSPDALTIATPFTVPSAPRALSATAGNRTASLKWSAPSRNGGKPVTGFVIQRRSGTAWSRVATVGAGARTYKATGLANGTRYRFRVLARNAAGLGAASNGVDVTPRTTATAPRALAAEARNKAVKLTWRAPASNGGAPITKYVVQRSTGRGWVTVARPTKATVVVAGLRNGQRYSFRVAAINAAGQGSWSKVIRATPHR